MKRWHLVILLLLSVGLNVGLLAQRGIGQPDRGASRDAGSAERAKERRERAREALLDRMVDKVGVTGEQRERFVAIHRDFFERTRDMRDQQRRAERALRENLASATPDRALAEIQLAEIAAAKKEIETTFVENYFDATAILDADQKARYRELVAELRRMRWSSGRGAERRDRFRDRRESRQERKEAGGS